MTVEKNESMTRQEKEDGTFSDKKPVIGMRWVLVFLSLSSYIVQFFVRNSFPVAVVAMVNSTSDDGQRYTDSKDTCPAAIDNNNDDDTGNQESDGEFDWNSTEQGIILGAYYWGFIISQLFVSRIGEVIGQRATIGTGYIIAGVLVLISPLAASIGPYALAVSRFLIGFCYGPSPALIQSLLSAWAPRNELATMMTTFISGAPLGGMVGLLTAGWLSEQFGWRIVFWMGGALNFLFPPLWIIFVRNTPAEHPLLSNYERKLLEGIKNIKIKKTVPWKKILLSPYVIICIYAFLARVWLDSLLATVGVSFFRFKIGLDLNTASYVCGANYFSSLILMLVYGRLSDFLINSKYLKRRNTRKLFHFIGSGIPALLLIIICLEDCNQVTVITLWVLIGAFACATACTFVLSIIDFAPNYAGTVMGLFAFGNLSAAIVPTIISALLETGNGWNKSFYLAAALNAVSCVAYIAFMTDEVQPWNFEEDEEKGSKDFEENKTKDFEENKTKHVEEKQTNDETIKNVSEN